MSTSNSVDAEAFAGRVSFYRRFGRPSNLSAGETVWIVCEKVVGPAEVCLNGERLGPLEGTGSFDITRRLAARNDLELGLQATDDGCGITGEVWLEIRTA